MSEIKLKQLNRLENKPYISIKDPISALTHFIGFALAILLTPLLLSKAALYYNDPYTLAGLSIYCLSLILLYGASSAYHTFVLPQRPARVLKKLDHCSIFILIAGTYTPICLNVLDIKTGNTLLLLIWLTALGGIILKLFWVYCPKYVSSILYILMGWLAIFYLKQIYASFSLPGFLWLLAGGILYTIGGILYALKISFSRDWSEHEVFHVFVLLGSLCHFIMIYFFVI